MRESLKIKESLRIVVVDKETGRIVRDERIDVKVPLWKQFLCKIVGKECHASLTDWGKEQIAKLLGGIGAYSINQIGTDTGGWKSASTSYIATGTLRVSNSLNPWTTAGQYTWIKCRNSGDTVNVHNSISIDITISSGQQWWADVDFQVT